MKSTLKYFTKKFSSNLIILDVEVGGTVERHEEVGDVGDALDPGRPRALVVHGEAEQLVDVGDPLHRVAHDEDEHDRQRDLRKEKSILHSESEALSAG